MPEVTATSVVSPRLPSVLDEPGVLHRRPRARRPARPPGPRAAAASATAAGTARRRRPSRSRDTSPVPMTSARAWLSSIGGLHRVVGHGSRARAGRSSEAPSRRRPPPGTHRGDHHDRADAVRRAPPAPLPVLPAGADPARARTPVARHGRQRRGGPRARVGEPDRFRARVASKHASTTRSASSPGTVSSSSRAVPQAPVVRVVGDAGATSAPGIWSEHGGDQSAHVRLGRRARRQGAPRRSVSTGRPSGRTTIVDSLTAPWDRPGVVQRREGAGDRDGHRGGLAVGQRCPGGADLRERQAVDVLDDEPEPPGRQLDDVQHLREVLVPDRAEPRGALATSRRRRRRATTCSSSRRSEPSRATASHPEPATSTGAESRRPRGRSRHRSARRTCPSGHPSPIGASPSPVVHRPGSGQLDHPALGGRQPAPRRGPGRCGPRRPGRPGAGRRRRPTARPRGTGRRARRRPAAPAAGPRRARASPRARARPAAGSPRRRRPARRTASARPRSWSRGTRRRRRARACAARARPRRRRPAGGSRRRCRRARARGTRRRRPACVRAWSSAYTCATGPNSWTAESTRWAPRSSRSPPRVGVVLLPAVLRHGPEPLPPPLEPVHGAQLARSRARPSRVSCSGSQRRFWNTVSRPSRARRQQLGVVARWWPAACRRARAARRRATASTCATCSPVGLAITTRSSSSACARSASTSGTTSAPGQSACDLLRAGCA